MHIILFQLIIYTLLIQPALAETERISCKEPYTDSFIAGEILVKFKNSPEKDKTNKLTSYKASVNRLLNSYDLKALSDKNEIYLLKTNPQLSFQTINSTDPCKKSLELIEKLNADDRIEIVEPNFLYKPAIVKDFFYNTRGRYWEYYWLDEMWGLKKLSPNSAWEYSTGEDILVAVIDSGVDYTHPDLQANLWYDEAYDSYGYDFYDNDRDPFDSTGHGTHVAGIIAASSNEIGTVGLAYNSRIISFRAGNDSFTNSAILESIYKAIELGADIMNCSYGSYSPSLLTQEAYLRAYEAGMTLVGAAGNDNRNVSLYPAKYSTFISVAASDEIDQKSSFSNYDNELTVTAPGSLILSTVGSGSSMVIDYPDYFLKEESPEHGYHLASGTSMATPFVSALAALIKSYAPELNNAEIKSLIREGASPLSNNNGLGAGLINAAKSLEAAAKLKSKKALDTNSDGAISLEEITKFIWASRFKKNSTYNKALDLNNDKLLSPEDFRIIWENNISTYDLNNNKDYKIALKALNAVDRNTNGLLSPKEIRSFRQTINMAIKRKLSSKALLSIYDINSDGEIDLEDKNIVTYVFFYLGEGV